MREQWILAVLIAIVVILTIVYPSLGWLGRATLFRHAATDAKYEELVRTNQSLEAALAAKSAIEISGNAGLAEEKTAFVYSRYPLNFKNELLVSSGSNQGTRIGDIAIIPVATSTIGRSRGIFLGRVIQLFPNTALVQTVFDPQFESAVRAGSAATDALLKGGTAPHLSLIPRRAAVKAGDIVYAASVHVPYGLAIGTVEAITSSRDNVFDEATVTFGYDINRLTVVHLVPVSSLQ